ncbi:alcohol dehydrogenase [Niveomyces insectorum RCEF 264]|uniref:Alcohol dehydrogenase n=1 Tax=Niveomyces insectorum RCEF 264 TaxID=1081102 RepID=A0A168AD35_9HYPO|nr:alcohol dehydrogenase [Niveomyces insectorum RCEF 264]
MDVWALTEWDKPLQKIKQPIPKPQGSEVLIRVTHAGICHSDLHTAEGKYDLGNGKVFRVKDRGITLPVALGHEIMGEVAAVGPDAGPVPVGSKQIVYPWLGCGACTRCEQEEDNLCAGQRGLGTMRNGGFAEYVVVPHPKYLVELGDLDPAVACTYGCSGITTLSAVSKAMPLPPMEPVLLIGAGGLGLAAISVLKYYGHQNIIVADIGDDKLANAKAAGATTTVNSAGPDAAKAILGASGGLLSAVLDFVNNSSTAAMVNGLIAKGGKWVQVGVMGGTIELSLVSSILRGLTIYSNLTGNLEHLRTLVGIAKEGKLSPVPVQKMPWDSVNEAMDLLRQGKVAGRLILIKE